LSATGSPPPPGRGEPIFNPRSIRVIPDDAGQSIARYGYFVDWDDNSFSSLKRNAQSLDALIVEWLHLRGASGDFGAQRSWRQGSTGTIMGESARTPPQTFSVGE